MAECSILYDKRYDYETVQFKNFRYMKDLNITDLVNRLSRGKSEFDLERLFSERMLDERHIYFRHEIFKDLENDYIYNGVSQFSTDIVNLKKAVGSTERVYNEHQKNWYKMNEVRLYTSLVDNLYKVLCDESLNSTGLISVRDFLNRYINSAQYSQMKAEMNSITDELNKIHYRVRIRGNYLEVMNKETPIDYSDVIKDTFKVFKQYETESYLYHGFQVSIKLNAAEEKVMSGVVSYHINEFKRLKQFANTYKEYTHPEILNFYKEIQFYLSYVEFMRPLKKKGLMFTYPVFNREGDNHLLIQDGFNVNVARANELIVTNDFIRTPNEEIFVIMGANQGGKTTFVRMIGQIMHFAQIGVPVAASRAELYMCTEILAHFEVNEDVATENGKLKEDLVRVKELLEAADEQSIIIFNEVFSSTTMEDAKQLGVRTINKIENIGSLCVYVTFLDKITDLIPGCVSMVSQVLSDGERTFKILRSDADGRSYAMLLAEKYNLTYDSIIKRIGGIG
ncbi:MAG: hypothetical protein K6G11_10160 [Lachnospiraceae bacterium]|nr:hypothetical protein [Lachnospiraceae bacterium]